MMRHCLVPVLATLLALALSPRPALADAASAAAATSVAVADGAEIYRHVCQGCHMPDGRGAVGAAAFPALARNAKLADADYPITMVLNGHGDMPWFAPMLNDAQIAAVVTYIRTHFGNNDTPPVLPADVAALRRPSPTMEH
jgi:mono/diheme cytochrome c family protein